MGPISQRVKVRLEQGSGVKSGQINTSPWVWQQLKTPGVGAGPGVGIVGNKAESRFHTEDLVTTGIGTMSDCGAGKEHYFKLCQSGFKSQLSSQRWCCGGGASHLSSLSLSFLLRQKKIRPLSKVCKMKGGHVCKGLGGSLTHGVGAQ